jgi:hypothetical protein
LPIQFVSFPIMRQAGRRADSDTGAGGVFHALYNAAMSVLLMSPAIWLRLLLLVALVLVVVWLRSRSIERR